MAVRSLSDSGVYVHGEAYQRQAIIVGWDPDRPMRSARVSLRVARQPLDSYAIVEVRPPGIQPRSEVDWIEITRLDVQSWWHAMPGFARAHQRRTATATQGLMDQVIDQLIRVEAA